MLVTPLKTNILKHAGWKMAISFWNGPFQAGDGVYMVCYYEPTFYLYHFMIEINHPW